MKLIMILENESKIKKLPFVGYFWEKSFFHYAWISVLYSVLNIFLLWLFIDILKIHTVVASSIVIGGTFILRYVLFRLLKIMG